MNKLRIVVPISGRGTNMIAIHKACQRGEINGSIVAVISDNPEAKGLQYARKNDIPDLTVDYKTPQRLCKEGSDFERYLPADFDPVRVLEKQKIYNLPKHQAMRRLMARTIAEAEMLEKTRPFDPDLMALAGFMRVFCPYLIDHFNLDGLHRVMNIHPAVLPAFPGDSGYQDALDYGCKLTGCTVHFVDYGEDTGPIIGQRSIPILPGDTKESLEERGLQQEWELYPECIQLFAEGRLKVVENKKGRKVVDILPVAA